MPYFIRSWVLLLRIKSAMKIKINLQITGKQIKSNQKWAKSWRIHHVIIDKPVDPLRTKLIHLVSTLAVLLYNGTCAFQYAEATFGNHNYTILESLYVQYIVSAMYVNNPPISLLFYRYVVMVTLSTVGYGGKLKFWSYYRITSFASPY